VLAAGGDYLADAAAIAVSLFAIRLARRPGGHPSTTTIAALVNAGWQLASRTPANVGCLTWSALDIVHQASG